VTGVNQEDLAEFRRLLDERQLQQALELAKRLVRQEPRSVQGWILLGEALSRLNRQAESWLAYQRGALFDPLGIWFDQVRQRFIDTPPTEPAPWLARLLEVPKRTLTAAIVVRNEERSIRRCLASVAGVVDEIVLVDTGSTDRTVEIASEFDLRLHHFEWTDHFAEARNFALSHVKTDWVLWIDGDEWLEPGNEEMLRIAPGAFDTVEGPFVLRIVHLNRDADGRLRANTDMKRMHPVRPDIVWRGRAHEQLEERGGTATSPKGLPQYPVNVRLLHDGYDSTVVDMTAKLERKVVRLRKAIEDCPEDIASWGFLGRELLTLGRIDEAIEALLRAEELSAVYTWFARMPEVRTNLIIAYQRSGMLEEARQVAVRGTEADPYYPDHWFQVGAIELEQVLAKLQSARVSFAKAKETSGRYRGVVATDRALWEWKADAALADAFRVGGDLVTARDLYQRALAGDPENAKVLAQLKRIEEQRSKLGQGPPS
jgi:glycosyltransferase involved in cell wall biosynthesis